LSTHERFGGIIMVRNIEPAGATVQIALPQQVTVKTLPLLERQVDDAIARRACLEMLCAAVQIVDSAGLNWLLSARARMEVAGLGMKLMDLSAVMADVFLATRLDSRFTILCTVPTGGERDA
jgi:anti-anti-sigma factor